VTALIPVSASGLAAHAALIAVAAALAGRAVPPGFVGPDASIRAALALGLAAAVLVQPRRAWRFTVGYAVWLGAFGAMTIGAQLFQRYVPDGSGNYILINPTMLALSIAMETALFVALAGALPVRQLKRPSGSAARKGQVGAGRAS
jgi:hypothetical protein